MGRKSALAAAITKDKPASEELPKVRTGIRGFDEITYGGLPKGRPTLVAGGAGCGKTMFAMEFIVRGIINDNEPGVYITFEENVSDLKKNFASLGLNLDSMIEKNMLVVDHIFVDRNMIQETGEYDLEGLFIRLGYAIDRIGAKRIALDTIEVLFAGLANHAIIRSELLRLFRWLKEKGITAVVTGEKGDSTALTRYGLEEYIADCVVVLDNRVTEQLSTRRMRIVKYRGSAHGSDEYPFLIGNEGIVIFPITAVRTDYKLSSDRVSSGIPKLDTMLGGKGFYKGSSILISGTAGTGKTSITASFVDAACRRGERCMYFALEETESQIARNMQSIGINLEQWVKKGLLRFHVARPSLYGLEMHLLVIEDEVKKFKPQSIVIDPISDFVMVGDGKEVKSMITRLNDLMKSMGITVLYTDLIKGDLHQGTPPDTYISSLIDSWLILRNFEYNGERNRGMVLIKSRGMAHSNQIREFLITGKGIDLIDPYIGSEGVFMGSAKIAQEAKDRSRTMEAQRLVQHRRNVLAEKQREFEARIKALEAQFKAEQSELKKGIDQAEHDLELIMGDRSRMSQVRRADGKIVKRVKA